MLTENLNKNQATILEIVRMSTEDGPGIRTTVFLKGCTLKCAWCHNPESISIKPQLQWVGSRCIGCKTCLSVCKENALTLTETGMLIDRARCTGCGDCAMECPGTALELLGKIWSLDDLVEEVIKDRAYFKTSDGGITISGGEPTMQAGFAGAFLKSLRQKGLHTALDTCGQCSRDALDQTLPYAAMVLFDMKLIDPKAHKEFTGHDNKRILDNLLYVADYIRSHVYPNTLWIRTPLIPNATATPENINGIGQFIAKNLFDVVDRWELCAFNNLCRDKYLRLDQKWTFHDAQLLTKDDMDALTKTAKSSGVDRKIVFPTGSTRMESSETEEKQEIQQKVGGLNVNFCSCRPKLT
ncbi:MAG: glycyl-radical enzyme activating protein [Desulfobacteraceae bacterium]|nr:glycyl-radical enzyme activating protein [Desulfobacteraceae bacterium]